MNDEFSEIMQTAEDSVRPDRPVMSIPPRQVASSKFIREVKYALDIEDDDRARLVADWVIDKMERFGAATARGVFDMDGSGPQCSWCGVIWPLCGHHHQSDVLTPDREVCPQPCEHLSQHDAREGRTCPEHPCTCTDREGAPDAGPH